MNLYFDQFDAVTEKQKVAAMLSTLSGSAGRWAEAYVKKNLDNEVVSYRTLCFEMEQMWGIADREGKAIRELDALKQETKTITEYVALFRQKSARCRFSDYDLIRRFRMGLQQRVRDQLAHVAAASKNTLETLIRHAIEIGQNLEELDAEKKAYRSQWTPRATTHQSTQGSAPKTVSQGGDAMDVDAQKQKGGPRPQVNQPGGFKCYRCGKEGHMARNCSEKPKEKFVKATTSEEKKPEESVEAMIRRVIAENMKKDF